MKIPRPHYLHGLWAMGLVVLPHFPFSTGVFETVIKAMNKIPLKHLKDLLEAILQIVLIIPSMFLMSQMRRMVMLHDQPQETL